jgi:deoxyribonuclease V
LKYRKLHAWNVTTGEAKEIQYRLGEMIDRTWEGRPVRVLAGADVGFPDRSTVLAAVVVLTYPELRVIETRISKSRCTFPYIPGYLAFREVPGVLAALEGIKTEPDMLMCDAQGVAHPRRMGLATHVGVLVDCPVIGCAKSVLCGKFEEPAQEKGSYSYMYDDAGEVIGAAVRTRRSVQPVYVSIGNRIDLETAIDLVLNCSFKYRIPEPLRLAHKLSVGGEVPCEGAGPEQELF